MECLRFTNEQIVWQEVPGETSLAYTISGCGVGCAGCHSRHTWNPHAGQLLTADYLGRRIQEYRDMITCVLFLGGEWQPRALLPLLILVRNAGLHRCLYTGLEHISPSLQEHLTYLKTGPWRPELGGLTSPKTNQRFIDLRTNEVLNHKFTQTF